MELPSDVEEIALSYMSLPELLALEKEDKQVAKILAKRGFWKQRIRTDFADLGEGLEDLPTRADLRSLYQILFIGRMINEGDAFEAGQLCLDYPDEDLLENPKLTVHYFLMGAYLAGCTKYAHLEAKDPYFSFWRALEEGNVSEVKGLYIRRSVRLFIDDYMSFFSENMIDTWIKARLDLSRAWYYMYISTGDSDVHLPLLEYFLYAYGRNIPKVEFGKALRALEGNVKIEEAILRHLTTEEDTYGKKQRIILHENKLRRYNEAIRIIEDYLVL